MNILELLLPILFFLIALIYVIIQFRKDRTGTSNRKIIESASALFPTIGILCTFLGIIIGFRNFNLTDPDKSIEGLIEGLKIAFYFSATGVFISLVMQMIVNKNSWTRSQKLKFEKEEKERNERSELISLLTDLVKENRIKNTNEIFKDEYGEDQMSKDFYSKMLTRNRIFQETILNHASNILGSITTLNNSIISMKSELKTTIQHQFECFNYQDENGNQVKPGNVLRLLSEQNLKQTKYLGSFSTDLSESLGDVLAQKIARDITPNFENMVNAIGTLGTKLQSPATDMTQNVVKDLSASMKTMMEEFKNSVNGSTKEEMEGLAKVLSSAGGSLVAFPEKIEDMTKGLNDNFGQLRSVMNELSENIGKQSAESMRVLQTQIENISQTVNANIGSLQGNQERLLSTQTNTITDSQQLIGSFKETIDQVRLLNNEVNNTISIYNGIKEELTQTASHLEITAKNAANMSGALKNTHDNYVDGSDRIFEKNKLMLDSFNNSFNTASTTSRTIVNNYEKIDVGLHSIFSKIEDGLNNYATVISDSMTEYLEKYSLKLTDTISGINSITEENRELLEELTELVKRLKPNT